jgi:hypothetical protein
MWTRKQVAADIRPDGRNAVSCPARKEFARSVSEFGNVWLFHHTVPAHVAVSPRRAATRPRAGSRKKGCNCRWIRQLRESPETAWAPRRSACISRSLRQRVTRAANPRAASNRRGPPVGRIRLTVTRCSSARYYWYSRCVARRRLRPIAGRNAGGIEFRAGLGCAGGWLATHGSRVGTSLGMAIVRLGNGVSTGSFFCAPGDHRGPATARLSAGVASGPLLTPNDGAGQAAVRGCQTAEQSLP